MKRIFCIIFALVLTLTCAANAVSETGGTVTEETTEEITETAPEEETDPSLDIARTFLNINFILFGCAVVLFIVCTVIFFVIRSKKTRENK